MEIIAASSLGVIAAISLALAVAAHLGIVGGPDFREALVVRQAPLSLNPLIGGADDPAVHDVGHLLYRSLLQLDGTEYPRPDLAKFYAVSGDGLSYRVVLNGGQRWSNGSPITPADVAATFAFVRSSRAVDRATATQLSGVTVKVEPSDIAFSLPAPRASFAATLTQVPILPLGALPAAQIDRLAAQPSQPLPTSGAYTVSSVGSSSIELRPNPYAAAQPHLSRIAFSLYTSFDAAAGAFSNGSVDALVATTPTQRARLLATSGAVAHDIKTFRFVDLLFNQHVRSLADGTVREAFALAVDRDAIVHGALGGGSGAVQVDPISQGLPWIAPAVTREPTSPQTAELNLDQAGWAMGATGSRVRGADTLDFILTVPDADPLPAVANELAAQLAPVGIKLRVEKVAAQRFISPDLTQGNFQLALGDWDGGPDPDVSAFWRSNATPPNGFNVSGAAPDPFLDQALDTLATTTDPGSRSGAAGDIGQDLSRDTAAVFLYTPEVSYVVRKPMHGMAISQAGGSGARFDGVAGWQS